MSRKSKKRRVTFEVLMSKLHNDTFDGGKQRIWLYGRFSKEEFNELKQKGWSKWG